MSMGTEGNWHENQYRSWVCHVQNRGLDEILCFVLIKNCVYLVSCSIDQ
jgi:hypothetical protein